MNLSTLLLYTISLLLSVTTSAWTLTITTPTCNVYKYSYATPKGCTQVTIPTNSKISWKGSSGAQRVQFFEVKGKSANWDRKITGQGDINASKTMYGFTVTP